MIYEISNKSLNFYEFFFFKKLYQDIETALLDKYKKNDHYQALKKSKFIFAYNKIRGESFPLKHVYVSKSKQNTLVTKLSLKSFFGFWGGAIALAYGLYMLIGGRSF